MTEWTRRDFARTAGASLLGATAAGCVSARDATGPSVTLLEAGISFDFGDTTDVEEVHVDRPTPYLLDPDTETLTVGSVGEHERDVLLNGGRVLYFRGIEAAPASLDESVVDPLPRSTGTGVADTAVATVDGYELPAVEIDWDSTRPDGIFTSDEFKTVDETDGFLSVRLASRAVEVRRKIVRDEVVDAEGVPPDKRSAVIDRPTATVEVDPYLTVRVHRDLTVVEGT